MGKYEKKTEKRPGSKTGKIVIFAVALILILTMFALFLLPRILYRLNGGKLAPEAEATQQVEEQTLNTEATETVAATETTEPVLLDSILEFPLTLENGNLEIESIFSFDGLNPDHQNEACVGVASIVLKNTSNVYLQEANIALTASDGNEYHFRATDLPAGKTAMLFSLENASADEEIPYSLVSYDAQFDAEASMNEDQIAVSVQGTLVTLQNNTDADLNNIVVYCHSTLGDQFFGGITYSYTVNNLAANGTAEVDAVDCILGLTEVVRIAIDHT